MSTAPSQSANQPSTIIRNARIVNRGRTVEGDIFIKNGRIEKVGQFTATADREIDAAGRHVIPGIIDDQVHFREPGLTHKADIFSESRAAVAGGVTSFMEMPNTDPPATTRELLEQKYARAAQVSLANYSFFMGTTNDNYDEVMRIDPQNVCGIKIFMGSSTGNMLVDSPSTLERIFANAHTIIATHCEDEATVRSNFEKYLKKYGEPGLTASMHPKIRSAEACILSSKLAVDLAKRHGTRLHVLHISTAEEAAMFENDLPLEKKLITAEVCVHHLTFQSGDYRTLGNLIKCNPAIKSRRHRDALLPALLANRLDIIATDHAPHTREEKALPYAKAPSGLPLVQHSLNLMLGFYHAGQISLERIVEKMCHAPATVFKIRDRGHLDEGCHADLVLVDTDKKWTVEPDTILYRCGWSPLEGKKVAGEVAGTFVNGNLVWQNGKIVEGTVGERLRFL